MASQASVPASRVKAQQGGPTAAAQTPFLSLLPSQEDAALSAGAFIYTLVTDRLADQIVYSGHRDSPSVSTTLGAKSMTGACEPSVASLGKLCTEAGGHPKVSTVIFTQRWNMGVLNHLVYTF